MKDKLSKIKYITPIGDDYFLMGLSAPFSDFIPGQFISIKIPNNNIFLRRPFGIVKIDNNILEICVKKVGPGTKTLSKLSIQDSISIFGPLGNGFSINSKLNHIVLIAGGYGIAPLLSLAHKIEKLKIQKTLYYGGASNKDLLYCDDFKSLGFELKLSTEHGSSYHKGLVTDLVKTDINKLRKSNIYSAGPKGMLKQVANISCEFNIPAQVSVDNYMACGYGVCLGCILKDIKGNNIRACKEGPVFDTREIDWERY